MMCGKPCPIDRKSDKLDSASSGFLRDMATLDDRNGSDQIKLSAWFLVIALALISAGCSLPARLDPAPLAAKETTTFRGIANARFIGDTHSAAMIAEGMRSVERERSYRRRTGRTGELPPAIFLA